MLFDNWTVADVCGAASIMCWLGAQLPQVIKNWQLQSCAGLALPFLINWLMGDITNLVGCILTEQLPFQTYLATYFCFVDIALVGQYFYYSPKPAPSSSRHVSPHASLILPAPTRSRVAQTPTSPHLPASAGLPRSNSGRGRRRTQPPASGLAGHPAPHHAHTLSEPYSAPAEALYAAALDVARAAERVSYRRSGSGRPRARHHATAPPSTHDDNMANRGSNHNLLESFHSEVSLPSSTTEDEDDLRRMTQSMGALDARHDPRGRSLTRENSGLSHAGTHTPGEGSDTVDDLHESGMLEVRPRRGHSRSQSRARTVRGSGRRAAGVAFMSLGMLLWRITDNSSSGHGQGQGHVIVRDRGSASASVVSSASAATQSEAVRPWQPSWQHPVLLGDAHFTWVTASASASNSTDDDDGPPNPPEPEPVDFKQLVGRISAWCCTTLYLTSRLPQIWKNFQRKSVEGLSILLFIFAFLGNTFYVLSIVLAAPPPGEQAHYLLRALPYLLGSGGTLVFDLTIMIQAAIYGKNRPTVPLEHRRTYSYGALRRRRVHTEEGLGGHVVKNSTSGERQPLLSSHSPVRSVTEPAIAWARQANRAASASSTSSYGAATGGGSSGGGGGTGAGGLFLRTSDSPVESPTNSPTLASTNML